ncbi:Isopentenyl-diphosphate Delta-isomerase [Planctomycetes bacterium Pla163]|uniref:isopentenyl-diphosphate Delta-isomerase n=1 Tax=Rohdeia mirabilis TaxID=2528008 RepID=A0A518D3F5_9BACT|nr:Isopentenyl-diphosphate Delta-isomerase [Planctomycetes bacterium Pla163]
MKQTGKQGAAGPDGTRPPVVLVDADGRALGEAPLVDAHTGRGLKHLAFTALLFDADDHLVLARRSATKPLWPGAWDGTFASHPGVGEPMGDAVHRRSGEELGLSVAGVPLAAIDYRVDDPAAGADAPFAEHEYCAVYLARLAPGDELVPDPGEVRGLRRVSLASLLEASPAVWRDHCPWLALALEALRCELSGARHERARAFDGALAALRSDGAGPALRAVIADLVPKGEWRVAPVLQNWK